MAFITLVPLGPWALFAAGLSLHTQRRLTGRALVRFDSARLRWWRIGDDHVAWGDGWRHSELIFEDEIPAAAYAELRRLLATTGLGNQEG